MTIEEILASPILQGFGAILAILVVLWGILKFLFFDRIYALEEKQRKLELKIASLEGSRNILQQLVPSRPAKKLAGRKHE